MNNTPQRVAVSGSAIRALLTRPVAFHPMLARLCGSVTAGLMLSQALYWTDVQERTNPQAGGWFYKTQSEWTDETCLTRTEQLTARKKLVELGFLEEERRDLPAKLYFRVILERVCEAIESYGDRREASLQGSCKLECRKPANKKSCKQERRNPAFSSEGNLQTFSKGTETTAETTPVSTPVGAALKEWLAVKDQLKQMLPEDEWSLWVRPAYLLTIMGSDTMLVALPPSGRIVKAARARLPALRQLLNRPVVFTRYPDDYDRERMKQEYPEYYQKWLGTKGVRAQA